MQTVSTHLSALEMGCRRQRVSWNPVQQQSCRRKMTLGRAIFATVEYRRLALQAIFPIGKDQQDARYSAAAMLLPISIIGSPESPDLPISRSPDPPDLLALLSNFL